MPATLVAQGVTVVRGPLLVLSEVSLTVAPGTRLGVVGPNGVGKSTLLACLAGRLVPEKGTVSLAPRAANVGLLPQEPERLPTESVQAFLLRRTGVTAAQHALDAATDALTRGEDAGYDEALERWLSLGGADLEQRAEQVCADIGLSPGLLASEMTTLSGGQAARASLASILLSRYDVFLLDEPTNDLDFAGLERLERFVQELQSGLVLVSHDREFLSRTVTSVLDIDGPLRTASLYNGGWDAFLDLREVAKRQARDAFEEYDDKRAGLVTQAQRQREQSVRGALRAKRKVPDNDRAAKGARIEAATHAASRVKGIESQLNRLDEVAEPRKEWQLQMSIAAAPAPATSSRCCPTPSCVGAASPSARCRCRSPAATASPSWAPTDRARPPCSTPCSAGSRWCQGVSPSGPGCGSVRSTRTARSSPGTRRSPRCWSDRPSGTRPPYAPCSRSSGCVATTRCDPVRRCHRASGPARLWRCCRRSG